MSPWPAPSRDPLRPDHLFVCSARADWPLAEWLTLRLTEAGYRVWCDRFPVIGDERFPRQTDAAIRQFALRVLVLFSLKSMSDPRFAHEYRLALETAGTRNDLVVPITVDGVGPADVGWTGPPRTFVPFHERWDTGLTQLLTMLEAAGIPRPIADGTAVAAAARRFLASRRSWHTSL